MPGDYLLSITAAGYDTTGAGPAADAVPITLDPQPDGLLAGEAVNETEVVSALLAPAASCPTPLKPPNPNLPDLAGLVRNAATGLPITTAQETLTPDTGGKPPSPNFSSFGAFAWWSLDPGGYALSVSAPGYLGIGIPDAAGTSVSPIPVTEQPGPLSFPDGGSVVLGKTLEVWLVPAV